MDALLLLQKAAKLLPLFLNERTIMDEFLERQFAQMRFQIIDFRSMKISLNDFLSRVEGISRVIGDEFWSEIIFPHVCELEQINVDIIEDHRELTLFEKSQVEKIISQIESDIKRWVINP